MLQLGILSGGGGQELQHLVKVHHLDIPLSHPLATFLSSTCHLLLVFVTSLCHFFVIYLSSPPVQVCPHLLLLSSPQPGRPGEDGRQGGSWQAPCFAVWLHQAAAHGLLPPEEQEESKICPSTPHTTSKTSPAYSDPPGPQTYTDLSPSKAIAFRTSRTRLLQAESSQMWDQVKGKPPEYAKISEQHIYK